MRRLGGLLSLLALACSSGADAAGTVSTSEFTLDDGDNKPGACEPYWTARTIHYNPHPVAPRYSSTATCASSGGAVDTMFTVINRKIGTHMNPDTANPQVEVDTTIGSVVKSTWDSGAQEWVKSEETEFSEILYIGGIVAAADCTTIAFIATRKYTDCGHDYTDVSSALAPCENADCDLVANSKGAWTGDEQQLKDLGWSNPLGYCFEDAWKNEDVHGPKGAQPRWPAGVDVPQIAHLWLYEWTGAAASVNGVPSGKVIINKMGPLDNWGQMVLAFGHNDGDHGTYAFSGTTACCCGSHVADSFIVVNRAASYTDWAIDEGRSNIWATGFGHTVNNRMTYNPATKRYLRWVTTDNFDSAVNGGCNNTEGQEWGETWYGSLALPLSGKGSNYGQPWSNGDRGCRNYGGGYAMMDGDQRTATERHVYGFNLARQYMTKGTLATLVPLSDGGFLGVLAGEPNVYPKGGTKIDNVEWYAKDPPTSIGVVRFDADGVIVMADGSPCEVDPGTYGGPEFDSATARGYGTSKGNTCVKWIRCDPLHYLSYPVLAALGNDRFLLGWTEMIPTDWLLTDFTGNAPRGENNRNWNPDQEWPYAWYMRLPQAFWVTEIDAKGDVLTEPQELDGVGWGEFNNMATMGDGKVVWTYIKDPTVPRVRPEPADEFTVKTQKESSPPCSREADVDSFNPVSFQTAVYTQAGTDSAQPLQLCDGPADGQPVCLRVSPPLRNESYGCGGPGGWERSTGKCAEEDYFRFGGAADDGSRGPCGDSPGNNGGDGLRAAASGSVQLSALWPLEVCALLAAVAASTLQLL